MNELIPHDNRGYCYDRVKTHPTEAAFAASWEAANIPSAGINYGQGVLQDLFMERTGPLDFPVCHHEVTDSERYVAATVVQWLGSNCGMSFLSEALRKSGYQIVRIKY